MIKSLKINNFQSHLQTELNFHNGYNVLLGQSGTGKSSIIRALRLLFYNKPSGIGYITRPNGTQTNITVINDNDTFIRTRGKSKNKYTINDVAYQDFGTDIPSGIKKELPIKEVVFDDTLSFDIQFSSQLEDPFLLIESPSIKAKFLNRLSGLHILDKLIKSFNDDLRKVTSEIDIQEKAKSLLDIDNIKKQITNIKNILKYVENKKKILDDINMKLFKLKPLKIRLDNWTYKYNEFLRFKKLTGQINYTYYINSISHYNSLYTLKSKFDNFIVHKDRLNSFKIKIKDIDIKKYNSYIDTYNKLSSYKITLDKIDKNLSFNTISLSNIRKEYSFYKDQFINQITQSQKCPTCGQSIQQDLVKDLVNKI